MTFSETRPFFALLSMCCQCQMTQIKQRDIFSYCLIIFNVGLSCVILNWTICFTLMRELPCLHLRQPIIPIMIGLTNVFWCSVGGSQILIHSNISDPIEYGGWRIVTAMTIQLFILSVYIVAYRGWIIYYDISFNKALQDKQWRLYINPAENNWFLKHRQNIYGSKYKVLFPFLLPWILFCSVYLIEVAVLEKFTIWSRTTLTLEGLLVMVMCIVIWYKMPKFDDIWRIRHELILTIRLMVMGLSIFFAMGIILNIQPGNWKYAMFVELGTAFAFGQSYAMLFYPLKRFNLPKSVFGALRESRVARIREHMTRSPSSYKKRQSLDPDEDVNPSQPHMSTQFFKLKAILLHRDGFRLFAAHLMKEFSIENLLFFVESSQWQNHVLSVCQQNGNLEHITLTSEKGHGIDVKFHHNIPQSRIVFWNPDDDRPVLSVSSGTTDLSTTGPSGTASTGHSTATSSSNKSVQTTHAAQLTVDLNLEDFELETAVTDSWMMAVKIFRKYIVNGSYFCVNISGEDRIELYEQFGYSVSAAATDEGMLETLRQKLGDDLNSLFHIFDTARYSVFRLMIYSVSRFENSEQYLANFLPSEE